MFRAYCVPKPRSIITRIRPFVLLYSAGGYHTIFKREHGYVTFKTYTFFLPIDQICVALSAFDRK